MLKQTVLTTAKCKRALFGALFGAMSWVERLSVYALLFCCIASFPALLFAEHTRGWRQSTYEEFLKGTATGVAVRGLP